MSRLFLTVRNMSLTASYVILFVMLIRLLLKKAPKFISYALWSVAAFRLVIPFSFESVFSLMPRKANAVLLFPDSVELQRPQVNSSLEIVDSFMGRSAPTPVAGTGADPIQYFFEIGAYIWLLGMIALLIYSFFSVFLLKRRLKGAQLIEENIFEVKNLKTPFVLGILYPKIYLPFGLREEERNYILIHEQIHIRRKDPIIKAFAFLIVSIHWFNPLVWIAFCLMSTDMELSCDERVLQAMNEDVKKPYARSLLNLAGGRHILNAGPLAFGAGDVKGRIKNILNYKKPRFSIVILAVFIIAVVGVGLITNPVESRQDLSIPGTKNTAAQSNQKNEPLVFREPEKSEGYPSPARANPDSGHFIESKDGDEIAKFVEENLAVILSSPRECSDARAYIQAHQEEYENILKLGGEAALQYMLSQFESGNADGLRGQIMMQLCKELLGIRNNVTDETLSPQEWYENLSIRQEIKLPDFEYDGDDPIEKLVYAIEIEMNSQPERGFTIVAPKIFGSYEEDGLLKVFVTTFSATYRLYGNVLDLTGGSVVPSAITFKKYQNSQYVLEKYEPAKDGADWQPSIRKFCTMPVSGKEIPGLADKIIDHYRNRDDIRALQWGNLYKHLKTKGINSAVLYNSRGEIEFYMNRVQPMNE